ATLHSGAAAIQAKAVHLQRGSVTTDEVGLKDWLNVTAEVNSGGLLAEQAGRQNQRNSADSHIPSNNASKCLGRGSGRRRGLRPDLLFDHRSIHEWPVFGYLRRPGWAASIPWASAAGA